MLGLVLGNFVRGWGATPCPPFPLPTPVPPAAGQPQQQAQTKQPKNKAKVCSNEQLIDCCYVSASASTLLIVQLLSDVIDHD
jgi:hypothetical protein